MINKLSDQNYQKRLQTLIELESRFICIILACCIIRHVNPIFKKLLRISKQSSDALFSQSSTGSTDAFSIALRNRPMAMA